MATHPVEPRAAWTVLVYLAGDNNLTEEMVWGLQELKKTAHRLRSEHEKPEEHINVAAHFDPRGARGRRYDFAPLSSINRPAPPAEKDGNLDRYEAMVYTPAVVAAQLFGQNHRAAPGEAVPRSNQLAAFLKEQVRRLPPASRYFLILSGHGSGAVGDFLTDLNPASSLSIPELGRILEEGRNAYWETYKEVENHERTPRDGPGRIDVLGMDSCLMSNAEVCFEIRNHADFLVASEGFVANAGWPYHRVLQGCVDPKSKKIDSNPHSVALRVAQNYSLFYQDYEISGLSTDIAVCDLERFRDTGDQSFVARLRAFSKMCARSLDSVFVHDVLAEAKTKLEEARGLPAILSGEIAELLLNADREKAAELKAQLLDGSEEARKELEKALRYRERSDSQRTALRELLELMAEHHLDDETLRNLDDETPEKQIPQKWIDGLRKELDQPSSRQKALAVVRVRREFDPGVLEALRVIEEQEAQGRSEAKRARASLQKLHQVRWLLELDELTKAVRGGVDDLPMRNAVIAARWQAQSFKGGVYVDLFDLCRCLLDRLPEGDARTLCRDVQMAIENANGGAVLLSRYTGPAFQHAHGLSVYFPTQAGHYTPEYENLQFAKATAWGRFVRAYLRATRRERRDEATHWARAADHVLRFDNLEIDPLETDSIEARIVGVTAPRSKGKRLPTDTRAGDEGRIRAGDEGRIRAGDEGRIRAGDEGRIKGAGILAVWGNPPDGFFRQRSPAADDTR